MTENFINKTCFTHFSEHSTAKGKTQNKTYCMQGKEEQIFQELSFLLKGKEEKQFRKKGKPFF